LATTAAKIVAQVVPRGNWRRGRARRIAYRFSMSFCCEDGRVSLRIFAKALAEFGDFAWYLGNDGSSGSRPRPMRGSAATRLSERLGDRARRTEQERAEYEAETPSIENCVALDGAMKESDGSERLRRRIRRAPVRFRLAHDHQAARQSRRRRPRIGRGRLPLIHRSRSTAKVAELSQRLRKKCVVNSPPRKKAHRKRTHRRARPRRQSLSHDLRHYLAPSSPTRILYEADELHLDKSEIYKEIQTASTQMTI